MANLQDLPPRKQKYVKARLKGLNKQQATIAAGYAKSVAHCPSNKVETDDVRAVLAKMIQTAIPPKRIVDRLSEGLDAMETQFFAKDGIVTDRRDVVSWSQRRAYLELAAEYAGYIVHDEPTTNVMILQAGALREAPAIDVSSISVPENPKGDGT